MNARTLAPPHHPAGSWGTRKRSGKPWTEEQYRLAGVQLLHLRLKPEHHEPLDELCALWGVSRGEAAKRAIDEAHARHVAPYARRGVELPADVSAVLTRPPGATKYDKSKHTPQKVKRRA